MTAMDIIQVVGNLSVSGVLAIAVYSLWKRLREREDQLEKLGDKRIAELRMAIEAIGGNEDLCKAVEGLIGDIRRLMPKNRGDA